MKPLHSVTAGNLRKHRARRRSDAAVAIIDQLERRVFLSGTFTPIASFNGVDGANPVAVVQDSAGNQFGITFTSYASVTANPGPGVLFEIPANTGVINDLYTFSNPSGVVAIPSPSSLIIDSSGNLYGTLNSGIVSTPNTVFEVPVGTTTPITIATFAVDDQNGRLTAVDSAGNVYGYDGENVIQIVHNSGMITPLGDAADQLQQNIVDLRLGPDGNLYGVSGLLGDTPADLFEITPSTGNLQVLAAFDPTTSGYTPVGLTFDSSGNIWGFCQQGGPTGAGTVWEFPLPVTSATLTISFVATFTQAGGFTISSRPAFGTSGNLYGMTEDGGANGNGTIFALQPGATTLTDLYDWGADAVDPDLPEGIITNSSGFAPDTMATASTTITAEGALSVKQITFAAANNSVPSGASSYDSRNVTSSGGPSTNGLGNVGRVNGKPAVVPPPLTPEQERAKEDAAREKLKKEEEEETNFRFGIGIQIATAVSVHVGSLAEAQADTGTSLSSQLAAITAMFAETQKDLAAAGPLLSKFTAVDGKYTKEGTTLTALSAQLAAQTNAAKQAAIQKKITADEAVQASLLTQDDADGTATDNALTNVETLETNIDAALAAFPAPFAQLSKAITSVPALINPGKKGTAVLTVTNSGNVPVTISFQMVLSARPQGTTGSADITLATDTIKLHRLKPNAPTPERLSFLVPKTFPAGIYSLVALPVLSSTLTGTATPVVSTTTFTVT